MEITYQHFLDSKALSKSKNKKNFYYVSDIKYTLNHLNILPKNKQSKMKKKELQEILLNYFEDIFKYNKHIDSIIFLQRNIKNYLKNKVAKSNNEHDFYSFKPINEIDKNYLFSYKDSKGFVYSFDIRSFKKLLDTNCENPYNREKIPEEVIKKYYQRIEYNEKNNIIIEPYEEDKLTPEQIYKARVVKIFQTIDLLNTLAGGANPEWFLNLNIFKLRLYYKMLEDIWNYRAQLTTKQKKDIVKNQVMFPVTVSNIYYINDIQIIRNIILEEFEKMLYTSDQDCHRLQLLTI